jgi:Helix-turn-helix domain
LIGGAGTDRIGVVAPDGTKLAGNAADAANRTLDRLEREVAERPGASPSGPPPAPRRPPPRQAAANPQATGARRGAQPYLGGFGRLCQVTTEEAGGACILLGIRDRVYCSGWRQATTAEGGVMTMATPEVLDLDEVAALLRLSPATVLREAREGRLPGRRIDEQWRFARIHILEWLRGEARDAVPAQTAAAGETGPVGEDLEDLVAREGGGEPTPAERAALDENDALGER